MCPTSAGFDRAPREPKKTTSAGRRPYQEIRLDAGHLAAHRVGRSPLEHGGEGRRAGERLELVDAPDEPRAVEAAREQHPAELLVALGGAREHVRRADEAEGALQHRLLPRVERRERERRGGLADGVDLGRLEGEEPRERVGGLGARRGLGELELELFAVAEVVQPQAEQARDGLGAERRLRRETGGERGGTDLTRGGAKAGGGDEMLVELPDRHGPVEVVHPDAHAQRGDDRRELAPGEGVVGPEALDGRRPSDPRRRPSGSAAPPRSERRSAARRPRRSRPGGPSRS